MRHTILGPLTPESARRIQHMRALIEEARIPPTKVDENLILGTWNIRLFGAKLLWIEVDTWIEGEQLDAVIKGAADPG